MVTLGSETEKGRDSPLADCVVRNFTLQVIVWTKPSVTLKTKHAVTPRDEPLRRG